MVFLGADYIWIVSKWSNLVLNLVFCVYDWISSLNGFYSPHGNLLVSSCLLNYTSQGLRCLVLRDVAHLKDTLSYFVHLRREVRSVLLESTHIFRESFIICLKFTHCHFKKDDFANNFIINFYKRFEVLAQGADFVTLLSVLFLERPKDILRCPNFCKKILRVA